MIKNVIFDPEVFFYLFLFFLFILEPYLHGCTLFCFWPQYLIEPRDLQAITVFGINQQFL